MNRQLLVLFSFFFVGSFHGQAYAYLDPGTGSLLIQGLIAGVIAVAVAGRLYLSKGIGWFKGLFSKSNNAKSDPDEKQVPSKDEI